jgi:predicted ATPase
MITKLSLKNFRCFQDFTLDGVRPVTLIAGANNVGKTTILESVFLFMARTSPAVFLQLNNFRGIAQVNSSPLAMWESLFTDMDMSRGLSVAIANDGKRQMHTLTLSKDTAFNIAAHQPKLDKGMGQNADNISNQAVMGYPLKLDYKDRVTNDTASLILTAAGSILNNHGQMAANSLPVTKYLKAPLDPVQLAELFGQIDISGRRGSCVETLQILESRIKDLSIIPLGGLSHIYADMGLPKKLSINMLGDGINKLMSIVLIMLVNPNGIILIDEIENGFHYSFYPKLWEIIGKLAEDTKCQVFATTHSYECITGASVLTEKKLEQELFRFIRLDHQDDKVVPKIFENDSFEYALNNNWEVR